MDDLVRLVMQAKAVDLPLQRRGEAFGALVRRFQDLVFGCAVSTLGDFHLAEDAAQETFLAAWRDLEQLHAPAAFPAWLRRIAATQCSRATRRKRPASISLECAHDLPSPDDPHATVEQAEWHLRILAAVSALPENERTVITLFHIGEHSQKEIAAFLGVPVTTVQKRLFTARKKLRDQLRDETAERSLTLMESDLRKQRPSRDDRFVDTIRLFNAAGMGDADGVETLLRKDPTLVHATHAGQWGQRTVLHVAAEKGHLPVVELLLRAGADVHARDQGDSATPLHWAAGEGHVDVARRLIEAGADVNATHDMHERGPLGWAVVLGDCRREMAGLLTAHGAHADIFAAIALEDADRVRELAAEIPGLAARMSLCEDFQGPLHFALRKDRLAMAELLLELGADPDARTGSGRTPLALAAQEKKEAAVDLLLARGVTVDLPAALALGRDDRARELLEQPMSAEELGQALRQAAMFGREEAVMALLKLGAPIDGTGSGDWLRGTTALILAANGNHAGAAKVLVEAGADVRIKDEYPGATALHFASWHGCRELGELLLDRGADIALKDGMFDADAVGWAAESGKQEMIDFLLSRGAPMDISRAAYFGRLDTVRTLLEEDPSCLDLRGNYGTALHQAALHGHEEIVRFLLEQGADTSVPNRHGDTVLTMVRKARTGLATPTLPEIHARIEDILVAHGAVE